MSELDAWDVDNECSHGQLPWEPCRWCRRLGAKRPYPGVQRVAADERREVREAMLHAIKFAKEREQ